MEKHEQGFVRWAKGGIKGLIDPLKARDALVTGLDEAGINPHLAFARPKNNKPKILGNFNG